MDTESVRSGRSERSERSQRSNRPYRNKSGRHSSRERSHDRHRERHHGDNHRNGGGHDDTDRDDRSVTIAPLPRSHHHHSDVTVTQGRNGEERIEVQIMPQDENWGETTTAITGNTSETGFSMEDMSRINKEMEEGIGFNCERYMGSIVAGMLGVLAFLSPIAMVILPKLGLEEWEQDPCGPECEGLLISFGSKLFILLIGTWALFFRRPKATMPRIFIFRAVILFLVFIFTFAFWLFYGFRIYKAKEKSYHNIVLYAVSLVDTLLFIHYIAIILLEVRQLQPQYAVRITRSPDGESHNYTAGQLSIQRLAVWCLEQYYRDFQVYNPYLEHVSRRVPKLSGFKVYDIDGVQGSQTPATRSRAIFAAAARRRDQSHNDRFYEEQDYERRVRKRKARLFTAAEEAFTHIKRMQEESGPAIPMDPLEAAQAIFPSMARALQKYLRITRQQPRYTMENILQHLATCISCDQTPRAFLERYLTQGPVIWNDKDLRSTQTWVLICDQLLSRAVKDGTVFQLRQGDVTLLIAVRHLPHFNVTEEVIHPKNNKFVLRLNSETSV